MLSEKVLTGVRTFAKCVFSHACVGLWRLHAPVCVCVCV